MTHVDVSFWFIRPLECILFLTLWFVRSRCPGAHFWWVVMIYLWILQAANPMYGSHDRSRHPFFSLKSLCLLTNCNFIVLGCMLYGYWILFYGSYLCHFMLMRLSCMALCPKLRVPHCMML